MASAWREIRASVIVSAISPALRRTCQRRRVQIGSGVTGDRQVPQEPAPVSRPFSTCGNSSDSADCCVCSVRRTIAQISMVENADGSSSSSANCPTCRTLPCSYSAEIGSARTTFPRDAVTFLNGVRSCSVDDHPNHVAAVVGFAHDHISVMPLVCRCRDLAPCLGAGFHRAIFERVCISIRPERGDPIPIASLSALSASPDPDRSTATTTRTGSGTLPSMTRHLSIVSSANSAFGVASANLAAQGTALQSRR